MSYSFKSLALAAATAVATVAPSTSSALDVTVDNINAIGIGETVEIQILVCNTQAGDDDWYVKSSLSLPRGLEILSAQPVVHSASEGNIKILGVTQPGQMSVDQETTAYLQTNIQNFASALGDELMSARVNLMGSALSFASVLNGNTHATVEYSCHAEGHRYKGDGHIRASIKMVLVRGAMTSDYEQIILELAKLAQPVTETALENFFQSYQTLLNSNSAS